MKRFTLLWLVLLLSTFELSAQRFVKSFNTIAELLAAPAKDVHTNAIVLGFYAANDGGGGEFYFDGTRSSATNLGSILKPNNSDGRWLAIFPDGQINAKRFGAKGDATADDTLAIQSAIDFAEAQVPVVGVQYPSGNYLISSVTIKRASQRGISAPNLHGLGSQQMGARITQKIGATNDCFLVNADHLTQIEISNLAFVGNREDNLKNPFTVTAATTRTNFTVNAGSGVWPTAPASPGTWPYYGYAFFFTSENKYAGAGLVVNRDTGTGAIDLMPFTDTYATVTNSSYLLTSGFKVCFAEVTTETASFKTTTGIDSSKAGYNGINVYSDSVGKLVTKLRIKNVQMWHWHTGIRLGNVLANTIEDSWIGACSFAGIAGAFPGDNRDDIFSNMFIQGYYSRSNTGTTETLVLENTAYRKNLWGIYGLPSAGNMEMISLDNNVNALFVKDCLETKVGALHIDGSNGAGILFGGGNTSVEKAQSHFDHVVIRNMNSSLYSLVGPPASNPFYAIDVFGANSASDIENLEVLQFGSVRYYNAVFNAPVAHRISVDSLYTFSGATNLFSTTTTSFPPIANLRLSNSKLATSVGGVTNITYEPALVSAEIPLRAASTFNSVGAADFDSTVNVDGVLTAKNYTYLNTNVWAQGNAYFGTNLAQAKFTIYGHAFNATDSRGIFHYWGADSSTGDGRTDLATKEWRILTQGYTNANPRFLTLWGNAQQANNRIWIGGGDNAAETATDFRVYTGSKGQLGGTNHFNIDGSGNIIIPDAARLRFTDANGNMELTGNGSPEGVIAAPVGSTYRRKNGSANATFYIKESGGSTSTGWIATGAPGGGGGGSLIDGDYGDVIVSGTGTVMKLDTGFIRTFETMNDMVTAPMTISTNFYLMGYYAPNDGGGGRFYYDASSSATTNYGTYIKPSTTSGRIIRVIEGYISPKMYGAKGNYNSGAGTGQDDTVYFQQALNYCLTTGWQFRADPGNYQTTATLTVSNNFAAGIDFGNRNPDTIGGGAIMYLNATNVPFLTLIDPTRIVIENLGVYIKPMNGWGLDDITSQPQQNTNAYVFRIYGWGTFMTIKNVSANYGSGFLQNIDDAAYTTRGQARLFNCDIRNIDCRYGDWALDLAGGSGSSWDNLYFKSAAGNYTNQTAMGALRFREFIHNETFNRLNVEWSAFKKTMFDLNQAEIAFTGLHVEGIDFPDNYSQYRSRTANVATIRTTTPHGYVTGQTIGRSAFTDATFNGQGTVTVVDENTFTTANSGADVANTADSAGILWRSSRWWIEQAGGLTSINNAHFMDIRANWGYVTRQAMFYFDGNPRAAVTMQNVTIERLNENADPTYKLLRYIDTAAGAQRIQVDHMEESDVTYWTNSPSWYGYDDRQLSASRRYHSSVHFGDGVIPYNTYTYLTPPDVTFLSTYTNASGVLRLSSGTTEFNATMLQHANSHVYLGSGVHRIKCRFLMTSTATAATDYEIMRIGWFDDMSAAPQNTPDNGCYIEHRFSTFSDDRVYIIGRASAVQTTGTFISAARFEANQWYEVELILNNTGDQFRAYRNPRTSADEGNVTTNLPGPTVPLIPQIQFVKRGSSPSTSVRLDLDHVEVLSAPNGIN